ncbi:MAG: type II toxin-antitoxin system ParD family antitoxin [Myxococcales bacterium]|nr:type II toxin-antitoxin system ParD family antitoxin [Myxococcales bacterium]
MSKHLTAADLPEDLARFAEAQVAAGRFESVEDVLRAGKEALEHEQQLAGVAGDRAEDDGDEEPLPHDWNDYLRYRFEQGRAAFARGDYSEEPPAALMARIRARIEKTG